MDGSFVKAISCEDNVYGVAVDSNGSILVPLYYNGVQKFSKDGTKLNRYATDLKSIENVAEDEIGCKYILVRSQLHVLSPEGSKINVIDGFSNARQVVLDAEGYIYVAESSSGVTKY